MMDNPFGNLQRDARLLMTARGVRAFAFSYLGVIFAIYLSQLGYSTVTVGLIISIASASSAVMTAVCESLLDRYELRPQFTTATPRPGQIGGVARAAAPCPVGYRRQSAREIDRVPTEEPGS